MNKATDRPRNAAPTLTKGQSYAVADIRDAFSLGPGEFTLSGLAGTGKTTVAASLQSALGLDDGEVGYAAPTGKASNVLRYKLRDAGNTTAVPTTIHQLIYSPITMHAGRCPAMSSDAPCDRLVGCRTDWIMRPPEHQYRLIVVDEASMVNEQMHDDLLAMNRQSLVVFVGDHGQLPPVSGGPSPVIDPGPDFTLTRIHRQVKGSPILRAAMLRRNGESLPWGDIPGSRGYRGGDRALHGTVNQVLDILHDPETYADDRLIITYTNALRVKHNRLAREVLALPSGNKPRPGDKVICRANNHKVGIYNGQIGRVVRVREGTRSAWSISVELTDDGGRIYEGTALKSMFNWPHSQKPDKPFGVDLWDFAYCLTVHASQGSEADSVLYLRTPKPRGMREEEYRRLDYTAITRARTQLLIAESR